MVKFFSNSLDKIFLAQNEIKLEYDKIKNPCFNDEGQNRRLSREQKKVANNEKKVDLPNVVITKKSPTKIS